MGVWCFGLELQHVDIFLKLHAPMLMWFRIWCDGSHLGNWNGLPMGNSYPPPLQDILVWLHPHTSEIVERSWEMDDDLIVEIWTILNTDLTCILWKTCWTTFVFLYIVLCVCVRQMFLTVYLSNSEKHFTEVPVTPETLCRDVVDVCKEPGETDCYLAESWRGSGEDIYLHTWTDLWISTIQLKHNNAAGLMLYYYKIL